MNQTKQQYSPAAAGKHFQRLVDEALKTPFKTVDGEDPSFRAKVQHTMNNDESCLEFAARTGLGPGQAMFMTPEDITAFVDAAMARRADDPIEQGAKWHEKLEIPKRFTL